MSNILDTCGISIDKIQFGVGVGKITSEFNTVNCEPPGVEVSAGQDVLQKYFEEYEKAITTTQNWVTLLKDDMERISKAVNEIYEADANMIDG